MHPTCINLWPTLDQEDISFLSLLLHIFRTGMQGGGIRVKNEIRCLENNDLKCPLNIVLSAGYELGV